MQDLVGRRVQMKVTNAKWYLNHPDVYCNGSTWDDEYEVETYIHLACCLGIPIYGNVLSEGLDCWKVRFRLGGKTCCYNIDQRHFSLLD